MPLIFAQSSLGEHREYGISPPINCLAGDLLTTDGRSVYLIRSGVVIETREVTGDGMAVGAMPLTAGVTLTSITFFRSRTMAIALTLTSVNVQGEVVYMNYSDGSQDETSVQGLENARAEVQSLGLAKKILMADLITREPTLENADTANGSTISIDMAGQIPLILTRSV